MTPWTVALQAPLSMRFPRQEYWSVLPFPPHPGDHPNPGIEPMSPVSPTLAGKHWDEHMGFTEYSFSLRTIKVKERVRRRRGSRGSAAAAKSLQSCPTLCDLIDSSPPGSPVPGLGTFKCSLFEIPLKSLTKGYFAHNKEKDKTL